LRSAIKTSEYYKSDRLNEPSGRRAFGQRKEIIIPIAICMCLKKWGSAISWANNTNIRPLSVPWIDDVKRICFLVNTADHVFSRPHPICSSSVPHMGDVLV
jgi:hypothetical protein